MRQLFSVYNGNGLHATNTEYCSIASRATNQWNSSQALRRQIVAANGKFVKFHVQLNNSPGAGTSYTFTLRRNNAATDLTVTISDLETEGIIYADAVFSPGQKINIQCNPSGTPTVRFARIAAVWEGDNEREQIIVGGHDNTMSTSVAERNHCFGGENWGALGVGSINWNQNIPRAGTFKDFYVQINGNPGSGKSYDFNFANGISATITHPATTANNTADTAAKVRGDSVEFRSTPSGTPTARYAFWGGVWLADDDYYQAIMSGSNDSLHATNTEYQGLMIGGDTWFGTENAKKQLITESMIVSSLRFEIGTAPGVGKDFTFTVMKNSVATSLECTIDGTNKSAEDTDITHAVTFEEGDYGSIRCVPTGSPTVGAVEWSMDALINKSQNLMTMGVGI